MSFFDEVETTVANCFPEDHEVFTDRGFLSLASIADHFARDRVLKVACFVSGALEFHPVTDQQLTIATGEHTLVCIDSEEHGMSLTPTSNHRMYVKSVGNGSGDVDYSIQTAASLSSMERVAFQCAFSQGHTDTSASPSQLPFVGPLSLTSDAHIETFVWLYGYWIGHGGWLDDAGASIKFGPKKMKDAVKLDEALEKLPLAKGIDWHRADVPNVEGQWDYTISAPTWWQFFADQYEHKYADDAANGTKLLLDWYRHLSRPLLRVMVAGLCFAGENDSSELDGGSIYASSIELREQLVDACIRAGYSVDIKAHTEIGQQIDASEHDAWHVHYTDFAPFAQPVLETDSFRRAKYTGTVWCVTVPTKDQLILVRRVLETKDGVIRRASRPVVCGNTRFLQAIEDTGPIILPLKERQQLEEFEGESRQMNAGS